MLSVRGWANAEFSICLECAKLLALWTLGRLRDGRWKPRLKLDTGKISFHFPYDAVQNQDWQCSINVYVDT